MEQLELTLTCPQTSERSLEGRIEFSKIMRVWDAFHYAKKHDPIPGIVYYGSYYVPRTVKEKKQRLKERYPLSETKINQMTAKQARMVYHTIYKYLASQ